MEQYVKGFQRFHACEDVRPVTSCKFLLYYYCYYYYHFCCRCCCCRWWHWLLGLIVLRPSISSLLQSATSVITKCDRYYKVWQFYYKVRRLLQSATVQRTPNKAPTWSKLRSVVWLNVNKTIFGHLWHVLVTFNFHFELSTIRAEQFKQILFSLLVHF